MRPMLNTTDAHMQLLTYRRSASHTNSVVSTVAVQLYPAWLVVAHPNVYKEICTSVVKRKRKYKFRNNSSVSSLDCDCCKFRFQSISYCSCSGVVPGLVCWLRSGSSDKWKCIQYGRKLLSHSTASMSDGQLHGTNREPV